MYDPDSGTKQGVAVSAQGGSLVLSPDRGSPKSINPEALYPVQKQRGTEIYALRGTRGFRLGVVELNDRLVESRLPDFPERGVSGHFHPGFLAFVALAMVGVMGVILMVP
ncbi:MAG: hypothetical protein V2J26_12615 [Pacificimonas sp.]|nr:hypothetical protein [Pacificimonas sp.]